MSENHGHAHIGSSRQRIGWALTLTSTFMVVEAIGGLVSGSLALLADAAHMLTDTAALALAWLAARLAERPADRLRSYGYHRIQILAAFVNGVAFLALVVWIAVEAAQRLLAPQPVWGTVMFGVAMAGLLVNLVVFRVLHGGGHEHAHDLNLRGALVHVLGDLFGSVGAIVAAGVIIWTGWLPIDPLLSLLVALLILRSAWYVVRESAHILLEGTPQDLDVQALRQALQQDIAAVNDVHHVHVWSLTPERPLLTLHLSVAEGSDATQVLCAAKRVLSHRFGIEHSTVQVESGVCADEHV